MSDSTSMKLGLDGRGDLAIAELAFWAPATILTVLVCFRQGFNRQSGWFFILLLGLCRIIGGACTVALEEVSDPQNWSDLGTAAAITGSLGISFLLSAMAGLQVRLFEHMTDRPIKPNFVKALYLVVTVAIVLSIVGGIKVESSGVPSTFTPGDDTGAPGNVSGFNLGYHLLEAALVLLLVVFVALCGTLFLTFINLRHVLHGERRLVFAFAACMPFVFVRLLYGLISAFKASGSFNLFSPDVWVEAFMQVLEEFIVAIIFIAVGFVVSPPGQLPYAKDPEAVQYPPQQQYPQQNGQWRQ